jgi:hypothetical protein
MLEICEIFFCNYLQSLFYKLITILKLYISYTRSTYKHFFQYCEYTRSYT